MKKLIQIVSLMIPIFGISQTRLVLNNDIYINIENNAYLVIDNSNSNALTTSGTGGNILSESETDVVKWNIENQTGTYVVPFTTNTTKTKIPQTTAITNAGSNDGIILFSTYETAADNNTAFPSDVTNMNSALAGGDGSLFAVDRFWRVDASSYTTKPDVSMSFGYDDAANEIGGTNAISEANLQAQQFDSGNNTWVNLEGTANTVSNIVSPIIIAGTDLFQTWTLVDNSHPLPIESIKLEARRENEDKVILDWKLMGLEDCEEIEVERRIDDEEEFKIIGSASCNVEQYVDYNQKSRSSYYRIRVKNEGADKMSEVRKVEGNKELLNVRLYPNPTINHAVLEIPVDYEVMSFRVYDSRGRLIKEKKYNDNMRLIQLGVMDSQPDGMYMIDVTVDGEREQLKLIKNK